jgi:hypothetical protein
MKYNITRLLGLLFIAALAAAPLQPARAQAPEDVRVRVDLVAWGDEIRSLSFDENASEGKFTALSFAYSEPVTYHGPPLMAIYQGEDNRQREAPSALGPDGKRIPLPEPPKPATKLPAEDSAQAKPAILAELEKRRLKSPRLAALVPLPSGCSRATVLLAPLGKGMFQAYLIEDDPAKLPLGKVRVHNLSPQPISVRCNDAKDGKVLKLREAFIAEAPAGYFVYELAYQKDGTWEYQENNVVPIRPGSQTQFIVLQSDHGHFTSLDGSKSGYLQLVVLRRFPKKEPAAP